MRADTTTAIRSRLIAAMEQRTASLDGEARRALETRLAELRPPDAAPDKIPARPPHSGLRELIANLTREASPQTAAYPDIPALADFRQLWSTLRADSQLQQSVAHATTDAGPLNSTALANRAIALMRELSPAYLRAFLAYVDDLAWLEQMDNASSGAGSAGSKKKRARRKPPG
ncbi:hypothetical protein ASD22_04020 [Rhodanobacter sp. Root480]|uniref:DUF2894 domain-containing protein n=1 Tax=Rhodanobacter sp. Root480 TaxID=1736542 RepID=UPI0006FF9B12|nr:DUF2894 domain-containing protein [Rhodanobacter sp. Root480]KQX99434.1 hypothetical protein ASD22_04020 [Rhodanobacter sp. Root480]